MVAEAGHGDAAHLQPLHEGLGFARAGGEDVLGPGKIVEHVRIQSEGGDTHPELVRQVQVWLDSTEAERTATDVVEASADLTKDALRLIASAAPAPIAESELVQGLTKLGHQATDAARDATLAGLDGLASVTDGRLVKKVGEEGAKAAYEMNQATAKQVLKSLFGGRPSTDDD